MLLTYRKALCRPISKVSRGIKTKWRVHLTPSFSIPALSTTKTHKASRIHEIGIIRMVTGKHWVMALRLSMKVRPRKTVLPVISL